MDRETTGRRVYRPDTCRDLSINHACYDSDYQWQKPSSVSKSHQLIAQARPRERERLALRRLYLPTRYSDSEADDHRATAVRRKETTGTRLRIKTTKSLGSAVGTKHCEQLLSEARAWLCKAKEAVCDEIVGEDLDKDHRRRDGAEEETTIAIAWWRVRRWQGGL
jgi:cation transport regulator ChaB